MKRHIIDLFRLWLHEYFKHPLENIRQANPIVPGRLYYNFGNVCKAVPLTEAELRFIKEHEGCEALSPYLLKDIERSGNGINSIRALQTLQKQQTEGNAVPVRCNFCDFYKYGIPCPIYNLLTNGSTVCNTNSYKIIKHAPKV